MIELDEDVFDVLMDKATRYALIVSDGTVESMQRILRDHGHDMTPGARRSLAAHIVEYGTVDNRDSGSWLETLRELQPKH